MTQEERTRDYLRDLFSPMGFAGAAASGAIGQWRNRPREWGQGWEAYGKRTASAFTAHFEGATITYGLSSALHEDNRYLPSGRTGAGSRIRYAVASTFLARHDDGSRHPSISRLAGIAGASLMSRMWQPPGYRNISGGVVNIGTSFSVAVGFNVAREFLPRLIH